MTELTVSSQKYKLNLIICPAIEKHIHKLLDIHHMNINDIEVAIINAQESIKTVNSTKTTCLLYKDEKNKTKFVKTRIPLPNTGKSNGFRIVYYTDDVKFLLIDLYLKNAKENVLIKDIVKLLNNCLERLSTSR